MQFHNFDIIGFRSLSYHSQLTGTCFEGSPFRCFCWGRASSLWSSSSSSSSSRYSTSSRLPGPYEHSRAAIRSWNRHAVPADYTSNSPNSPFSWVPPLVQHCLSIRLHEGSVRATSSNAQHVRIYSRSTNLRNLTQY